MLLSRCFCCVVCPQRNKLFKMYKHVHVHYILENQKKKKKKETKRGKNKEKICKCIHVHGLFSLSSYIGWMYVPYSNHLNKQIIYIAFKCHDMHF